MNSPQITYDPEANALHMRFSDNEIAERWNSRNLFT